MKRMVYIHLNGLILPEAADSIRIETEAPPNSHFIIGIGELAFPSHPGLKTVVIENQQLNRDWIKRFIDGGLTPREYADRLTEMRASLEPLELVIESEIETLQHNFPVLIDFASWEVETHHENNIRYSLVMYEAKDHRVSTFEQVTAPDGSDAVIAPPPPRPDNRVYPSSPYTVGNGDTLTSITRDLGESAWEDLYNLNRSTFHRYPPQGGNVVVPGQQLILPALE